MLSAGSQTVLPTVRFSPATTVVFTTAANMLDAGMQNVVEFIGQLKAEAGAPSVMVFAVAEDSPNVIVYAKSGATGFLLAGATMTDLIKSIARMATGEAVCPPEIASRLIMELSEQNGRRPHAEPSVDLTVREREVWTCICKGRSNKEIAAELSITESTVKNHVHHVLAKLGVSTRAEVAARAFEQTTGRLP